MNWEQKNTMSCGYFIRLIAAIAAGIMLAPKRLFAQTIPVVSIKNAAAKDPVVVSALRGNVHLREGSGGTIAVFTGPGGKLMVNAGIAVSQKKITDALVGISNNPVTYLVNTHWHFDHAEGNEWLHNSGAKIIAYENTLKNLSKTITVKDWNYTFPPSAKGALPETVFSEKHRLEFNEEEIRMEHFAAAHTDSDSSVYFYAADLLHVGDTWWNAYYPFIDHSSGGTHNGKINACNSNVEIATDKTIIIPGHGFVGNRSQLQKSRDMLLAIRENVSKLKKAGRSLYETITAKPTASFDAKYGNFVVNPAFFTRLVYADV